MEWAVIGIVVVVVLFFVMRAAGQSSAAAPSSATRASSMSARDRQRVVDENISWLAERWAAADKGTIKVPRWFNDDPTARQLDRFSRDGLKVEVLEGRLTKGMASDVIGLFEPPDDADLEVLKRHGVSAVGLNQSRARHEVERLEAGEVDEVNDEITEDSPYWFPVEETGRKVDARLTLDYESTSGKQTRRDADVTAFYRGEGGCKFDCYCHLRNAKRTLSSKSVRRAIDRDTGEIVGDLSAFFEAKYDLNPEKPYDTMLQNFAWAVLALRYIGSVDGAVRAPERKLIAEFCQRRGKPGELDLAKLDALVKDISSPSKFDFQRFVRERTADPEVLRDIHSTAKALIATNKKQHTEHQLALEYMENKWGNALKT